MRFENVNELIDAANKIPSQEQRIKFCMEYFLETVEYDYAYLFAKGYVQGDISKVSNPVFIKNAFSKRDAQNGESESDLDDYCLSKKPAEGKSPIFDDILKLRDENSGNYQEFIAKLSTYIKTKLREHIDNEEIIESETEHFIQNIIQNMSTGCTIEYSGQSLTVEKDISFVLVDYMIDPNKYFPPTQNNGLLKHGVCQHYADYLVDFLGKVGVEAHRIDGTSEMGHAWVAAKVGDEYKSIDLTRAVFIRDGFKGIPNEQTSEDWLYANFEDTFKMQPTRTITEIDQKIIPDTINGENYSKETFYEMINKMQRGKDEDEKTL